MKFLFIVQGEGRGHMTQAISMQDILVRNGHEVAEVLVGKSERREIPKFFFEKIKAPVRTYESPNFLMSHNNKGILLFQSIVYNLRRSLRFFRSMSYINERINATAPDLVINFYEPLAGLAHVMHRNPLPYVCLGHQFLLFHKDFVFPKGKHLQRFLLNLNSRVTSMGAKKRIALSFVPMDDEPRKKLFVAPPLLRNEVLHQHPHDEDYILGYMLNAGYGDEIIKWHRINPDITAHFFWDKKDAPETLEVEEHLFFHRINDIKFLEYMKHCKGYASTSGFESICEAMYLRKPILMVPTQGHFEQQCNALDAFRAGAGIVSDRFDLDKLLNYIPQYKKADTDFIKWVDKGEKYFLSLLTT